MKWLSIIASVIGGVVKLLDILKNRQLMDAGEVKAINEILLEANRRTRRAIEIRSTVDRMPSNQLLDELRASTKKDGGD